MWHQMIEQRIGMVLPAAQQNLMSHRIRERMQALQLDAIRYFRLAQQDDVEWAILSEALTVNETRFMRHVPSLELAVSRMVPGCRVLSVGCSTGEELWSLLMLATQAGLNSCQYLGVDLNAAVLQQARTGRYGPRKLEHLPEPFQQQFGQWQADGNWQLAAPYLGMARFQQLNLLDIAQAGLPAFRVIYCHNVLIYFKKFVRRDILQHLINLLEPGGCLLLAPGEMTDWHHPDLIRIDATGTLAYEHR